MARQNQGRAGDFTGQTKARLQKEHAEEQALAAETMGLATAAKAIEDAEPVDLEPRPEVTPEPFTGEIEVHDVDVAEEIVTFRVNETLEAVTIGHGNTYDFEEGREYRAPRRIYKHLEEKGLIWH
jgi:hypothetical protein